MLNFGLRSKDAAATLAALDRALAIIEFDTTGKILSANANFCAALGYTEQEIVGQHHSLFVDPQYAASPDYQVFWRRLAAGEFDTGEYFRVGKGGAEVWIQASYNPVRDGRGRVTRVIKVAQVTTVAKRRAADHESKINALGRAQAIIEFTTDGTILDANANFLNAMGYTLDEVVGGHHSLFVDAAYAASAEYREFWSRLRSGEYFASEYRRLGKGGREVWIQASYNPVFDERNRVSKVVKFATVVTGRVHAVEAIAAGLDRLAHNDLDCAILQPLDSQFEKIREDFNKTVAALREALSSVSQATRSVYSGATEISSASDDLSRRTEQQAASLEETAAALDEITATINRSASSARQAAEAATGARQEAGRSGDIVAEAVRAIEAIESSSRQVNSIIGVIDEIAFQTNLLALNAGVEAARAGDAGKGFAVVAQEVRALAQRSAEAAKEIKTLIATSTEHVDSGVRLVRETGAALDLIVGKVADMDGLIGEIARSSQEQAVGLAQVNTAVNQMDQVTQQNAAMVEQATAAAASLKAEATQLERLVGQFDLGEDQIVRAAPGPVPATRERATFEVQPPSDSAQSRGGRWRAAPRMVAGGGAAAPALVSNQWEEF